MIPYFNQLNESNKEKFLKRVYNFRRIKSFHFHDWHRLKTALHEMAHALHHENFAGETGIDRDFRKDFEKLSSVFGPLITEAIIQRKSHLRGYAFIKFQEFWAVSVEYFFENSQGLKDNLPHLYTILCRTLNQDPLRPNGLSPFK